MILYTQDEVEKYTRMLARAYDAIRNLTGATGGIAILKDIERTMGWNVPPPMNAKPPNWPKPPTMQDRLDEANKNPEGRGL